MTTRRFLIPVALALMPAMVGGCTLTGMGGTGPAVSGSNGRPLMASFVTQPETVYRGMGYGQVSGQPGKTLNERRLMAIRAAKLEAYRDLAEQVYGIRLASNSLLRDKVLRDDQIRAEVDGLIRGAETVKIEPRPDQTYMVVLELSPRVVADIKRLAAKVK